MAILKLTAEPRTETGSRASRVLRATGFIPAVLYSHGQPTAVLKLNGMAWSKALGDEVHLVMLEVPGVKPQVATVREIQRDPLSQEIIHVDLLRIEMDEAVHFAVRVDFTGTPQGAKDGGVTQILTDHIEVECLPSKVPDLVQLDIADLNIGDSLHASQVALPEGVKLITDPGVVLVSVTAVRIAVAEPVVPVEGEAVEAVEGEEAEEAEEAEEKEKGKGKEKEKD